MVILLFHLDSLGFLGILEIISFRFLDILEDSCGFLWILVDSREILREFLDLFIIPFRFLGILRDS